MNRIIFTTWKKHLIGALFEDRKMLQVRLFPSAGHRPVLDEIYVGRVSKLKPNINAAFLDLGMGEDCYFSLEENPAPIFTHRSGKDTLCVGDELLVQVEKEAQKKKLTTVTSNLTVKGELVMLTTGKNTLGISKKMDEELRSALKEVLLERKPEDFGVIVRTNASKASQEEIASEMEKLAADFRRNIEAWTHRTVFSCVRKNEQPWLSFLKDIYVDLYEEIVTDVAEIEEECPERYRSRLRKNTQDVSLAKLYNFEGNLAEATREKVWLPSGAYLVIQPTEALTVIDVNSGKNVSKGSKDRTHQKINLEAAQEIGRQLRLRNLSGIILIDFIDVADTEEELMAQMRKILAKDPIPTTVVDMTSLHLMELTRKKVSKPLFENLQEIEEASEET